jgi:hypothetical protein
MTDHDGYGPVLEVDYRYMRDASLFHSGLHHGDQGIERYWLFPEMLNAENAEHAVPAKLTWEMMCALPTTAEHAMSPRRYHALPR